MPFVDEHSESPFWGMWGAPKRFTLNGVATPRGMAVTSAASVLSDREKTDLIAVARGLPETWAVQVLPPHGQLAITPLAGRPVHHRCYTASLGWRAIRHENGSAVR